MKVRKTIFRRAASLIAQRHFTFSCTALKYAGANEAEMNFYNNLFKPENKINGDPWWDGFKEFEKNCRIFALLLAAEMA